MPITLLALFIQCNDITTTLDAPPKMEYAYPAEFREKQLKLYPDLQPLVANVAPEQLFAKAEAAARAQGDWEVTRAQDFRIEAVATTSLMKFKDDIAIEVRPESGGHSSLHMRSRSRVGKSDLAANYKRIRAFLALLAP